MAGEVVVGVLAHSLALISDAAHMLTDAAAIALALIAMRLAARPPRGGYTYGLKRAEILSAQANGITLLLLAAWLGLRGGPPAHPPARRDGGLVLVTALAGVVVNLAATWLIGRANRSSLNVEGAFQHILNDLLRLRRHRDRRPRHAAHRLRPGRRDRRTHRRRADAQGRRRPASATPAGSSSRPRPPASTRRGSGARPGRQPGVVEVHDLHVWEITSGMPAASAHVLVALGEDCHAVRADLEHVLEQDYQITHTTLQVDHASEQLLTIERRHCDDSHGPSHRRK